MDEYPTPIIRPLIWMGNSKKTIQGFPDGAKKRIGDELQLVQFGGMPKNAKPFKGIGTGVFELAIRHDNEAYRAVLAVQLGSKIYVLHAFHKKSKQGISTPNQIVELIRQRYADAKELAIHE